MAETEGTDGDAAEVGWRGFFTLAVLVITLTCLMRVRAMSHPNAVSFSS